MFRNQQFANRQFGDNCNGFHNRKQTKPNLRLNPSISIYQNIIGGLSRAFIWTPTCSYFYLCVNWTGIYIYIYLFKICLFFGA